MELTGLKKNFKKKYTFTPFQAQKKIYLCLVTPCDLTLKIKNILVGG